MKMNKYSDISNQGEYCFPKLCLLNNDVNDNNPQIDTKEHDHNKKRIVEVLHNFGIEVSDIKISTGPSVLRYEIILSKGDGNKIQYLKEDIELNFGAMGIRVVEPLYGKDTMCIEVPHSNPHLVSMKSLLSSTEFQESDMELPCAIGKTFNKEVVIFDLAKAPNLMITGAGGIGLSMGIQAVLTSLLFKKRPTELKIILIDPKRVEFTSYNQLVNHFLAKLPDKDSDPIVTDVSTAISTLNSLYKLIEIRYSLLKNVGASNIIEYNKKYKSHKNPPCYAYEYMPYIVVAIDEFGELLMTAGEDFAQPIEYIVQKAHAVGIHIVIVVPRHMTRLIPDNIKLAFPVRMNFRTTDFRKEFIQDCPESQYLLGGRDMLFQIDSKLIRVECANVDEKELERVNHFIAEQQGFYLPYELPKPDIPEAEIK